VPHLQYISPDIMKSASLYTWRI